jgi:hypothetical protein
LETTPMLMYAMQESMIFLNDQIGPK